MPRVNNFGTHMVTGCVEPVESLLNPEGGRVEHAFVNCFFNAKKVRYKERMHDTCVHTCIRASTHITRYDDVGGGMQWYTESQPSSGAILIVQ